MKFLVSGGKQRMTTVWKRKWFAYERAMLLSLDTASGQIESVAEHVSPIEATAGKDASISFKAGSLFGDCLYLCTGTEVIRYDADTFKVNGCVTLPCFNDLHHVLRTGSGIHVVSTGLDMVVTLDNNFAPIRFVNVLGDEPWHRFSPEVDYRKLATTKPHQSHPNYLFEIDDKLWVTRFEQRDAVCLDDNNLRIIVGTERIHDGFVSKDDVYFTTVDGTITVANKRTRKIENIYDLNRADDRPNPLGWCRGLFISDNVAYVGFSSLRSTAIRENIAWVMRGQFNRSIETQRALPTRIVEYDMSSRTITREFDFSRNGLAAIFSVMPMPQPK